MFGFDSTFRALADPTRRRILRALRDGPQNAGELAQALKVAPSALSFHLKTLKAAELIIDQRHGQYIRYRLNTSVMEDAIRFLLEHFSDGESTTQNSATTGEFEDDAEPPPEADANPHSPEQDNPEPHNKTHTRGRSDT